MDNNDTFGKRISLKEGKGPAITRGLADRGFLSLGNLKDDPGDSIKKSDSHGSTILKDYVSKLDNAFRNTPGAIIITKVSAEDLLFKLSNVWDEQNFPNSLLGKITPSDFRKNVSMLNEIITQKFPSTKQKLIVYSSTFVIFVISIVVAIIASWDWMFEILLVALAPSLLLLLIARRVLNRVRESRIAELTKLAQVFSNQGKMRGITWRFRIGSIEPPSSPTLDDNNTSKPRKYVHEEGLDLQKAALKTFWIIEIEISTIPNQTMRSQAKLDLSSQPKKFISASTNNLAYKKPKLASDGSNSLSSFSLDLTE
jgi:hypothetical protein